MNTNPLAADQLAEWLLRFRTRRPKRAASSVVCEAARMFRERARRSPGAYRGPPARQAPLNCYSNGRDRCRGSRNNCGDPLRYVSPI